MENAPCQLHAKHPRQHESYSPESTAWEGTKISFIHSHSSYLGNHVLFLQRASFLLLTAVFCTQIQLPNLFFLTLESNLEQLKHFRPPPSNSSQLQ